MGNLKIFSIFLLFQILIHITKQSSIEIASIESQLPYSITLNNGNVLIAVEKGIYLYDISTGNIKSVLEFTDEQKISSEQLCIQTRFVQLPDDEGGNILCLIKNIIHLFSPNAIHIKSFDLPEINGEIERAIYSLNFYKKVNHNIYYTIVYNDNSKSYLLYYEMNISSNENILKNNKIYEPKNPDSSPIQFNINLSCELMKIDLKGKVIVCFFENRLDKEISSFIFLPDNDFEDISPSNNFHLQLDNYINLISSAGSTNLKKSLICYLVNNYPASTFCFFFNIDDFSYTEPIEYSNICVSALQKFRTFYFQKTNQFLFTCGGTGVGFQIVVFNDKNEAVENTEITGFDQCYGYYAISLAFFENISKYLLIIDIFCNTGRAARFFSLDNINNITITNSNPNPKVYTTSLNIPSTMAYLNSFTTNINTQFPTTIYSSILDSTNINAQISSTIFSELSAMPSILDEVNINSKISTEIYSVSSTIPYSTNMNIQISTTISYSTNINSQISTTFFSVSSSITNKNAKISTTIFSDSLTMKYIFDSEKINYLSSINIDKALSTDNINNIIPLFCPESKPLLKVKINECVKFCSSNEILKKKCIIRNVTKDNFEIINENMRQIIQNNKIDKNESLIIEGNNIIYQISTMDNIKNNKYENLSSIDFGNCEQKIKKDLHIDYIIIQKADIKINNITFVKYELYNPNNKEQFIDLSICKEEKVQIYSPVNIEDKYIEDYYDLIKEGYDILNPNDKFYNDICSPYTSKSNTDVILYDRKITFYNPNLTYCDQGCTYKKIEMNQKKIQCECPIKTEENFEIVYEEFSLSESFYKINQYSNFKVIKCFKLVFSKKGQNNNYGSYFLISIISFYTISSLIYYINAKTFVANLIKKLLKSMNLKSKNLVLLYSANPVKKKGKENKNNHNNHNNQNSRKNHNSHNKKDKHNKINNHNNHFIGIKALHNSHFPKFSLRKSDNNCQSNIFLQTTKRKYKTKTNFENAKNKNKILNKKNNYKYNDEEMNSLDYEIALIIDKRGFFKYYLSLLNKKQLIFFTFISKEDYNIRIVKFALFLISFSLYFTVSACFFVDKTIHIIHEDKGIFNILFQLPQILYSSLISVFCNMIIKSLALSEKILINTKKKNKNLEEYNEYVKLYKYLRNKIILFFKVGLCFLLFFWYFISAFCAVYKNTQNTYLKDCSISFCISMAYPFLLNLIPAYFRILSLKNNKRVLLYKISNIIALI